MVGYLKSHLIYNICGLFNTWCRRVKHGNINFITVNQTLNWVENLGKNELDLQETLAMCDIKTCVTKSNRQLEGSVYELGSMLDDIEGFQFGEAEPKEFETPKSRDSGDLFASFIIRIYSKRNSGRNEFSTSF